MRSLVPLMLGACAPAALPDAESPPPPSAHLSVTPVYPGATTTVEVRGLAQGTNVFFFRGHDLGAGWCPPAPGACLDIVGEVQLGTGTANANGVARITGVVPATVPIDAVHYFQAITVRGGTSSTSTLARASNADGCGGPANLSGANLSHLDLSGVDLGCADLSDARLVGADLTDTELRSANLDGAWLDGARLDGANLRRASLVGASLRASTLSATDFTAAEVSAADFRHATGTGPVFSLAVGTGPMFGRCVISGAQFAHAVITDVDARFADLPGLSGGAWIGGTFDDANLYGSTISGRSMTGTSMRRVDARTSYFGWTTFTDVSFEGADLQNANFEWNDWFNVSFVDAFMPWTTLNRAEGVGADFTRADLRLANASTMTGLTGVVFDQTICPDLNLSDDVGGTCW